MNNNILTIKKNITLRYTVTGCAWLLYGILALIPNTISKIISIVSLPVHHAAQNCRYFIYISFH